MTAAICFLSLVSFVLAWVGTWTVKRVALRIGFVDKPGHRKIHHVPKPLGGGVAIFWAIALPLLGGVILARALPLDAWGGLAGARHAELARALAGGMRQQTALALGTLACMTLMHALGLWDDRRALGPYFKLAAQLTIIAILVVGFDLRAITALDKLGFGKLPSWAITILWVGGITNAFNFLDNMDGLSAGIAAVCATAFLITALTIEQWFVAGMLAMLVGALVGFLCFNFAPASIFMGDSGSLLIGFVLGVLTVRTTYLLPGEDFAHGWYALFAPVIVLALPLYDFIVVSVIRLSRGRSPFVGDTNHFSHRLVARGMSRRTAVLCLWLITAATSVAAIILPHIGSTFGAMLIFAQTVLILCVVALLEQHPLPAGGESATEAPGHAENRH